MTINSGLKNFSNIKGNDNSKMNNNKINQKKKTKKTSERFDWMIQKHDNFFDQY